MPPPIGGIHIIVWRGVDVFQGGGGVGGCINPCLAYNQLQLRLLNLVVAPQETDLRGSSRLESTFQVDPRSRGEVHNDRSRALNALALSKE